VLLLSAAGTPARAEQAPPALPAETAPAARAPQPVRAPELPVEPAEPVPAVPQAAPAPAPVAPPAQPPEPAAAEPRVDDGPWTPPDVPKEPPAGSEVDSVDDFTEPLAPYGQWTDLPGTGRVWIPDQSSVGADFRPYADGTWDQTEYGWTFVSDYDWGWAPFHYGRWVTCAGPVGWAWVPGTVWSPGWVHWRWGAGYVGWSTFGRHSGYRGWNFVPASQFGTRGRPGYVHTNRIASVYHGANRASDRPKYAGAHVGLIAGPSPASVQRQGGARVGRTWSNQVARLEAPRAVQDRVASRQAARGANRGWAAARPSGNAGRSYQANRGAYRSPAYGGQAYRANGYRPSYRAYRPMVHPAYRNYYRPSYRSPSSYRSYGYSRPSYSRPSYSTSRPTTSRSFGGVRGGGGRRR
jgi:hypothetical protein